MVNINDPLWPKWDAVGGVWKLVEFTVPVHTENHGELVLSLLTVAMEKGEGNVLANSSCSHGLWPHVLHRMPKRILFNPEIFEFQYIFRCTG